MSENVTNYNFFSEVRQILDQARSKTVKAVNSAMVEAYWLIGKRIVEEEQGGEDKAEYGKETVKHLSQYLSKELGRGFSVANLWNMRQFYLTYGKEDFLYALRRELSWTHHRTIMRVEDSKARQYYLSACAKENWSSRVLERQIRTNTYARILTHQKHKTKLPDESQPTRGPSKLDLLKDPYVLEFLDLPDDSSVHEKELESALINDLQKFLLELGGGFSFVARQMRISTETSHFYLDLVFYNYLLKCFVVIDLKTTKLAHQDIGQMDMYVRMFDDLKRGKDDNPTIGIILCADKDEAMVKYSVLSESEQLFASKYRTILPTEEELIAELERKRIE